jgi:hypothetical protein
VFLAAAVWPVGCGQPVREDRTIQWSGEGKSVGYQHGQDGVFLADQDGGKLTKVFQPASDVIATSTPLWNQAANQVIFATARPRPGSQPVNWPFSPGSEDPAGALHLQQDVTYTCWLCERTAGGKPTQPVALFESACDHPGYVAANLAVRWDPRANRIYYIGQTAAHEHRLFQHDPTTRQSKPAFPHAAEAMIFDWTPDGSHLVCVLGGKNNDTHHGIWIGRPDRDDWWHVPDSGELATGELPSVLEQLRASRPAWTADGSRFAFPTLSPPAPGAARGRHCLRHCNLSTRVIDTWAECDEPFRDLRWDPAGKRLGVIQGAEVGSLRVAEAGTGLSSALHREPVRHFIGWSVAGDRLAYVAPDKLPLGGEELWSFFLIPDELARDVVYVADGLGRAPGKSVFAGLRVTFPQWSPTEDKLSLWCTFTPAYRSLVSQLHGWGLRPGDPAAIFDLHKEQINWMAVNAQEKVQVGHYYLLKRDYEKSWRWYEEANRALPRPHAITVERPDELWRSLRGPRDFSFFQYYCLSKLNRPAEARAKLEQFRALFLPRIAGPAGEGPDPLVSFFGELLTTKNLIGALLEDLYCAEVFLSLDAAPDGERFFRQEMNQTEVESQRLSRAIVLGQILLLQKKHQAYADLTARTIAPLLLKVVKPPISLNQDNLVTTTWLMESVGMLSLMPLFAPEYVARLPESQLTSLLPRWGDLRAQATTDTWRFAFDSAMLAACQKLGRKKESQEIAQRLKGLRQVTPWLALEGDISKAIWALRKTLLDSLRR